MWDPRSYADTDYGLGDDEQFEPDDIPDADIDIAIESHIMTVLGPIAPDDLGVCQPFEHLLVDAPAKTSDDEDRLNDVSRALEELTSFVTAGGRAIVDATTKDMGRDILGLLQVARRVPAHIIASTGTLTAEIDDPGVFAAEMRHEITGGIGPRHVRPGAIIASLESPPVSARDRAILTAIAETSRETGLPVTLRVANPAVALQAIDIAVSTGVSLSRLTIGATGGSFDRAGARHLADTGAFVLFSGIGNGNASSISDPVIAQSILELVEHGYEDRILVSQGLDKRSQLLAWNGSPGLVYLLERFTLILMEAGAQAPLVRSLLVENPARALTIIPPRTT
jgi:phosphotriesterase-related protein